MFSPDSNRLGEIWYLTESIRYLDLHKELPEDAPPELEDSYDALLAPLLLNSALAALRAGGAANAPTSLDQMQFALQNRRATAVAGGIQVHESVASVRGLDQAIQL